MNSRPFRSRAIAISLFATFALSGCGGGGDGTAMTLPPAASTPTLAEVLPDPDNQFTPVSGALRRTWSSPQSAEVSDDFSVTSISSDGANGLHLTYVQDGEENTVHFTAGDYDTADNSYFIETDDGSRRFYFWSEYGVFAGSETDVESSRLRYFGIAGGDIVNRQAEHRDKFAIAFGIRTEASNLPAGTATYFGSMYSESQLTDNPQRNGRRDFAGRLLLTADFGGSTLDGRIGNLRVRRYDEQGTRMGWEQLPGSNHFAIENGGIAGGQFMADLTGMDPDANPLDNSVKGFDGSVRGEFYGPEADELGAVVTAESQAHNRVLSGRIEGKRLSTRVPGGEQSTLSTAANRDYAVPRSTQLTDAAEVTAVESDGAGGFHVTYRLDGADERVQLGVGDFGNSAVSADEVTDTFHKRIANRSYGIWDPDSFWSRTNTFFGNPEFDYFNVNGWFVVNWLDDDSAETVPTGFVVYGAPTEVADLPAGTARYAGRVEAESWPTSTTSRSDMTRLTANFSLTADFADSTIGGMLDNLEASDPGGGNFSPVAGSAVLQNGAITGNQFNADFVGQQDVAGVDGNMEGQFFGPGAAEVGGVLTGTDSVEDAVIVGWFGGTKQ